MLRFSAEDKKEKSIPQSGCASARPAPRQHNGPLWLSRSRAQKFKTRQRTLQTCVPLSSSPPPCTGLFHSRQRRVPTSSSCPHNNLQLFSSSNRRHGSGARVQPCAGFVRLCRAPDPRRRACASLGDRTTEHSHRPHVRPFFLSTIRAVVACAHGRPQPRRGVLPRERQENGKRTRLRDGDPAQTVRTKPERPSLLSNSTAPPAPPARQSVFVLHLTGSA